MIRLAVRVQRAHAEIVLAELLELAPAGVEETEVSGAIVEYAVYGAPGELPGLPDLQAAVGDALVEVSTREVAEDWHERWKAFHRPVMVAAPEQPGDRPASLRIRPPWEPPRAASGEPLEEIVIDPGQAFGTGAHASTRLCLELLLELSALRPPRGPLLDVGTGSGVLAIAAARLGFAPVMGLDNERESVEAARENASLNGVEIQVRRFDLRAERLPASGARPVVLANLLRPLLLELAERIEEVPTSLIAGGLLRAEADEVARAFASRLGLRERERRESGEWAALWLLLP